MGQNSTSTVGCKLGKFNVAHGYNSNKKLVTKSFIVAVLLITVACNCNAENAIDCTKNAIGKDSLVRVDENKGSKIRSQVYCIMLKIFPLHNIYEHQRQSVVSIRLQFYA